MPSAASETLSVPPLSGVDVSVLVPVRDEERNLDAALAAMRSQDFEGTVEFLVIDGGSTDSTLSKLDQLARDDRRIRVVVKPGWSIPERLNFGLRSARGAFVARMDAHALFPPRYLSDGLRRLAVGDVTSVSGPQIARGNGFWSRRIALALRSPLGHGGARFRRLSTTEIEVDSGYCGIWPRALLLAHGGWDERAVKGEDMELAFRVRHAGGRIVCVPSMAAQYSPRENLSQLALQYWRYAERRAWAASLHPQILRRSHVLPPTLALSLLGAVLLPSPLARAARLTLRLYGAVVLFESIRLAKDGGRTDAIALPAIFATMHLAWGFGFLFGCLTNAGLRRDRIGL